jgi:hypothetical protein
MSSGDTKTPFAHPAGPHGLGGMLWMLGVPLMLWGTMMLSLLPLAAWRLMPAQWSSSKASFMEAGWSIAKYRLMIAEEFLLGAIWFFGIFVAEAFFRRSPHFRWAATLWLATASLFAFLGYSRGSPIYAENLSSSSLVDHALKILPLLLPIPYLWLSRRARNTFSSPQPPPRSGWKHAFLDGPRHWGGGVWCIVGVIALLVVTHGGLVVSHWPQIFAPVLSAEVAQILADPSLVRGNTVADLALAEYQSLVSQVPYARWSLAQHVTGLMLAVWSLHLFVRRSPIMRWALLGSALLKVTVQITGLVMRDGMSFACFICHDDSRPGDGLDNALAFFIVAVALLLLPAVRRRFRKTDNASRL